MAEGRRAADEEARRAVEEEAAGAAQRGKEAEEERARRGREEEEERERRAQRGAAQGPALLRPPGAALLRCAPELTDWYHEPNASTYA